MISKTKVTFCGVEFKNPIVVASTDIGRYSNTFEVYAKTGVGGIITKSVTDAVPLQNKGITMFDIRTLDEKPLRGSIEIPNEYYFFSRGGAMIAMDSFEEEAKRILEIAKLYDVVPIASVCASKIENWVDYSKRFEAMGYPMLELNLGNPHGEASKDKLGFRISQETDLCVNVAKSVIDAVSIPVIVKLTPQLSDIVGLTKALKEAGVQAVTVMHRFQGLMIDHETLQPLIGGYAAIGGPWMKPMSLANVAKVYNATGLSVIGSNGADNVTDVMDFIHSGASLVEIGSSMMLRGPKYAEDLVRDFKIQVEKEAVNVETQIGLVAKRIIPYTDLQKIGARVADINVKRCEICKEKPCLSRCFYQSLKLDEAGKITHDEEVCSGCGMCQHLCPLSAVTIKNKN